MALGLACPSFISSMLRFLPRRIEVHLDLLHGIAGNYGTGVILVIVYMLFDAQQITASVPMVYLSY